MQFKYYYSPIDQTFTTFQTWLQLHFNSDDYNDLVQQSRYKPNQYLSAHDILSYINYLHLYLFIFHTCQALWIFSGVEEVLDKVTFLYQKNEFFIFFSLVLGILLDQDYYFSIRIVLFLFFEFRIIIFEMHFICYLFCCILSIYLDLEHCLFFFLICSIL